MRKLFIAFSILSASFLMAAMPAQNVSNKAIETFSAIFKDASEIRWRSYKTFTDAAFIQNDRRITATFDNAGNLIQTISYYKEDKLPPMILNRIRKTYAYHEIFNITEVFNSYGHNYKVLLRDDKKYYYVNVAESGQMSLMQKYNRADL